MNFLYEIYSPMKFAIGISFLSSTAAKFMETDWTVQMDKDGASWTALFLLHNEIHIYIETKYWISALVFIASGLLFI